MKMLIIMILLTLTPALALAETVNCSDEKGKWDVSFEISDINAFNIQFYKYGVPFKNFGNREMAISRILLPFTKKGKKLYNVSLGGIRYLDFERKFNREKLENKFPATFMLTSNPVEFEKHVTCIAI